MGTRQCQLGQRAIPPSADSIPAPIPPTAASSVVLSVNEVLDRADELDGKPVEIVGLLTFEFENHSLGHYPKEERRKITEAVDPPYYQSSVWITFGTGSIQPNQEVLMRCAELPAH